MSLRSAIVDATKSSIVRLIVLLVKREVNVPTQMLLPNTAGILYQIPLPSNACVPQQLGGGLSSEKNLNKYWMDGTQSLLLNTKSARDNQ